VAPAALAIAGLAPAVKAQPTLPIIDAQAHPTPSVVQPRRGNPGRSPSGIAATIITVMDRLNIQTTILSPPPFPPTQQRTYGLSELASLAREYPRRLAFVAGGESLNQMLQETPVSEVTSQIMRQFIDAAEEIAQGGAAGFGELAVVHFGNGRAPYMGCAPDHPLLLALTDVAVRHQMPIGVHMEAVPHDMTLPENPSHHPGALKDDITPFERLLDHNPSARINWLHAGWDLTGERSVSLMRHLLTRHSNLFMTIKSDEHGSQKTTPFLPDFSVKPAWLEMLQAFPDRFAVGSDQFYNLVDQDPTRIEHARKFVDALPPEIAQRVGRENAHHIYRL
jgi:hypothetical protein